MTQELQNNLNEIFNVICDVSLFLNGDNEDILNSDVKFLYHKAHFIEKCVENIILFNLSCAFEFKLKQFLEDNGKVIIPNLLSLKNICDEVFVKILHQSLQKNVYVFSINEYLHVCGKERFVQLIISLTKSRLSLLKLSKNLLKVADISINAEAMTLLWSWLKIFDTHEDGNNVIIDVVDEMIKDGENTQILLVLLDIEYIADFAVIQEIIKKKVMLYFEYETCGKIWTSVFLSRFFIPIIKKNESFLELSLKTLERFGNVMKFDVEKDQWICENMNYSDFLLIFKELNKVKSVVPRLRKFLYFSKSKGNKEFWKEIEVLLRTDELKYSEQSFYSI